MKSLYEVEVNLTYRVTVEVNDELTAIATVKKLERPEADGWTCIGIEVGTTEETKNNGQVVL